MTTLHRIVINSKRKLVYIANLKSSRYLSTKNSNWKTVVGLEIHAQISSNSKLFSGAKCDFGALVNSCVSLFDASIPGTLPVLNKRCVEAGVLTALALSCTVNPVSMFDRKHYFYSDLPAGYQITQQRAPLAQNGHLKFQVYTPGIHKEPYSKVSQIKQIQLEQDSGKSLHDENLGHSLVDLNRAGNPLMELVFEPDLEDGEEAAALVNELLIIFDKLNSCSGRMEEGALRVDANVSVHKDGEPYGTRTEIKNIGSVRGVAGAIKHESSRQIKVLESGGIITNETRAWDPTMKKTIPMRDKEVKQDYRFMPEPNLPPLILNMTDEPHPDLVNVRLLQKQIPELPDDTRKRLVRDYDLSQQYAKRIVDEKVLYNYFIDLTKNPSRKPKSIADLILNDFLGILNKENISLNDLKFSSDHLAQIIDMKQNDLISVSTTNDIILLILNGDNRTPEDIVNSNGWKMINDDEEIEKICFKVMEENPKLVQKYKAGKTKVLNVLYTIVKKQNNSKINMKIVVKKFDKLLQK